MTPLLRTKEVERLLRLAKGTLAVQRCRRTSAGRIPYTLVGRTPLYKEEDIQAWLTSRTVCR